MCVWFNWVGLEIWCGSLVIKFFDLELKGDIVGVEREVVLLVVSGCRVIFGIDWGVIEMFVVYFEI